MSSRDLKTYKYVKISKSNFFMVTIHSLPICSEGKIETELLSRIDDILDKFHVAKYFLILDLASRCWHIPIHPDDFEKLAFVTNNGLY